MSRQHQRNRRRVYGRRQHEIRERHAPWRTEPELDEGPLASSAVVASDVEVGFAFLASPRARQRWAEGAA